jgi:flagellar transcriptional activator FlhD
LRTNDESVWALLANQSKGAGSDITARLHASILMAGRHEESAA